MKKILLVYLPNKNSKFRNSLYRFLMCISRRLTQVMNNIELKLNEVIARDFRQAKCVPNTV